MDFNTKEITLYSAFLLDLSVSMSPRSLSLTLTFSASQPLILFFIVASDREQGINIQQTN